MAIYSEIGRLRRVMVHRPGPEVEEMTPSTAQQLLYNEIVPVESVQEDHDELREVLSLVAETVELEDVLVEVASTEAGRRELASALSGGSCTAGGATARAADAALTGAQTEVIRRWADTSPRGDRSGVYRWVSPASAAPSERRLGALVRHSSGTQSLLHPGCRLCRPREGVPFGDGEPRPRRRSGPDRGSPRSPRSPR
jgi:hypothetical protein